MSKIEIIPVTSRKELKQFVQFFYDLYRGNDYAVPYLFSDEMSIEELQALPCMVTVVRLSNCWSNQYSHFVTVV